MSTKITFLWGIIFTLMLACGENISPQICDTSNIDRSDILEIGLLDSNNVFHSKSMVLIYDSTINLEILINMGNHITEYGFPVALKMTIKREIHDNKEIDEYIKNNLFFSLQDGSILLYPLSAHINFFDKKCNKLTGENIWFYLKEKTDSNYVLTTQFFLNGEIFGKPIFLIDDKSFWKLNGFSGLYDSETQDKITLLPASQSGHIKLTRSILTFNSNRWFNFYPEHNLSASFFDFYSDTIETIIDVENLRK